MDITVKVAGKELALSLRPSATLGDVAVELSKLAGLHPPSIKLLGISKRAVTPAADPNTLASDAGLKPGMRLMALGSAAADVAAVQAAQEPDRSPGFEHEVMRAAARRRQPSGAAPPGPPTGTRFTFGAYEVMRSPGLQPGPEHALTLLYRLANDPGIIHIMAQHRFSVGKLAEMPPEGLVGVDPVCVLGLNTNQGQCIHLRLRTDDLKGFRKYESIRATLVHELTHNVWGDHDANFKALCSQLNRVVEAVHAQRRRAAHFAADPAGRRALVWREEEEVAGMAGALHPAMAATSGASGRTLRQAGGWGRPAVPASTTMLQPQAGHAHQVAVAGSLEGEQISHSVGGPVDEDVDRQFEHPDVVTEALEAQQRQLEEQE